ncbi:MAG TPA: hypothetical protein V6C58_23160 [Allocoleopsis sp.]
MSKNINKFIKNDLKEVKNEPMSDITIEKYLPNAKILEYSELKKYNSLTNLLPKNKDYVIVLFRHATGAHWIVLLRLNDAFEIFCSYGSKPDEYYFDWATQSENLGFGQNEPYITKMINNTPNEVIYNPIQYQFESNNIATCGRHVLNRIFHMLNHNSNLNDYFNYMKRKKNEYNKSYDDLVSIIVNRLNN